MNKKVTVSILGCGWYGLALAKSLIAQGIQVKGSTTSAEKLGTLKEHGITPFIVDTTADGINFDPAFFNCDILWIAIPPKRKAGEVDDYIKKIQQIVEAAKRYRVKQVIHISSTGIYGDHNHEVDELTPPEPTSVSGKALLDVEDLLRAQTAFGATIVRFGGLFGPGRNPGRFFAGKKNIPNGQAPVNMIHLDDCIGISHAIMAKQAFGHTFNACSPYHPPKADFYTKAASSSGMEKPEFIDELNEWKIVNSVYVNEVLGYTFNSSNYP
ncbi:SDR family NAD(P)-dependent oxidoreductase [Mucilaginibacter hurinus]|uniref:SDR family NAD(P)-dependent oxidoreductase n=1 Tax=Mucilaginibacter hurinus TaxID=2201324 RepID=A0A367GRZ7_9SPHI|nr:SDR family oxidoreductase [Mucilaginibacter hurinus]RCH56219.1 SDR family NAD(P)-dependent oxidoreductase [Mucilaginibacter hurinus]